MSLSLSLSKRGQRRRRGWTHHKVQALEVLELGQAGRHELVQISQQVVGQVQGFQVLEGEQAAFQGADLVILHRSVRTGAKARRLNFKDLVILQGSVRISTEV